MKYPLCFTENVVTQTCKVTVPDLPGCEVSSESMDEAFNDIKMVIENHLKILSEYGEPIPQGNKISDHQKNIMDVVWGLIEIDITPYLGRSHKINVTLPELLIKQIDDRVSKSHEHKTRSGFIADACIKLLLK